MSIQESGHQISQMLWTISDGPSVEPWFDPIKEIWEERYGDNPDVIGCDLDGSKLIVPDNLKIPEVPELLEKEVIHRLTLVSQPGLVAADLAFPPQKQSPSPPVILDKEIRAIFLSFLVKTLYGYRKALQFTRIHPSIQTRLVEDMFISPNDEKTFKADLSKARFHFNSPCDGIGHKNYLCLRTVHGISHGRYPEYLVTLPSVPYPQYPTLSTLPSVPSVPLYPTLSTL